MRQLAAYAATVAGVFSVSVLAGVGVAVLVMRRREVRRE